MLISNYFRQLFAAEEDIIANKVVSKMKEEHVCNPLPEAPKPWYLDKTWISIILGSCAVIGQIVALIVFFAKMDSRIADQKEILDRHEKTVEDVSKINTSVSAIQADMVWIKSFLMSNKKNK